MRTPVTAGRLQGATDRSMNHRRMLRLRAVVAWRALAAAALLALALGVALYPGPTGRRSAALSSTEFGAARLVGLSSLPASAQDPVSAALGADSPAYRVRASGADLRATNPAQHLRALFGRSGVRLRSGALEEDLSLRAVGYGRSLSTVGDVRPSAEANRVLYAREGLTEWYANGPLGLEQGFTVARAPSAAAAGPLTLSIALSGNAHVLLAPGAQSVTVSRSGVPSLRYGGLAATDAQGRALHSWLELRAGRLLVRVNTRGARYPLRIDPLVQQAQLEATGEAGEGRFGRSVALSEDGNTALIGGPRNHGQVGAAWVFARSGSTWTQQAKLEAEPEGSTGVGEDYFGRGVALSSDGNTALVGDPGGRGERGAAWLYTRSGSTWTQQAELEGGGEIGGGQFGARVALSADGATALIGGFADNGDVGAAWVFTGSGATWTQQAELVGGGEVGAGEFGRSVALSADGATALIGGSLDNGGVGAVWAFTGSGATWTQQAELVGGGEVGAGEFGRSVALSADGATALIGGSLDNGGVGAAWVFTGSGATWMQQAKLDGGGEVGEGEFGGSVALSPDAHTALIGGAHDDDNVGAAWLFTGSGSTWTQQGPKLTGGKGQGEAEFGFSAALAAEAGIALVGGIAYGGDVGAAWAFVPGQLTVENVEPDKGPAAGGTPVTITGSGFVGVSGVSFGSRAATGVKVESPTQITAISPPGSGTVDVRVSTEEGTSARGLADQFTYVVSAAPTGGGTTTNNGVEGGNTVPGSGILSFVGQGVPAPQLGVSGNIAPVSGTVLVRLPGTSTFVSLSSLREVPFGTLVDATHGRVRVITVGPHGIQIGEFFGGEFVLNQNRRGLVVATLAGGDFSVCPTARERSHLARTSSKHASGKHVVRKLWADAHGSYSTKGNYAAGAVQGTEWLTEDLCEGTLIRVTRDKVVVTNLVNHHHLIVKTGHKYLAKAP